MAIQTGLASNAPACSIRTLHKFQHIDFCGAASASPELDRSSAPSSLIAEFSRATQ